MPTAAPPRVDGSMSLLVDMMSGSLDDSYRDAAARRAGEREAVASGAAPVRRRTVLPLLVLLGLLTGTAAAQVRGRADAVDGERAALVAEVERRTAGSDALVAQREQLRVDLTASQEAALARTAAGRAAAERLGALELASATVPVRGPGLVVELDDAPQEQRDAAVLRGEVALGRVQDRDLQDAVNGLWAAGAEAVSVNDLRLTALTAIRSAGEAVLVDFRPISPPYRVRAIGAPELARRFADGVDGRRLATYPERYGLRLDVREQDDLRLPAAGVPALRTVRLP